MSVPGSYFQAMYEGSPDPWSLATRWYDRRKYDLTVAALPKARYRSVFEPGCSVGELSVRLAARCDRLLSCDRESSAVAMAAGMLSRAGHARAEHRIIPDDWPQESFDLIVLSEILYYFDRPAMNRILERSLATLEPGGTLAAVHWRHPVPDHAQDGDAVHDALQAIPALAPVCRHTEPDFILDVFVHVDPEQGDDARQGSVAAGEGLL
jgi:SAM-dependent methyltransferase